MDYRAIFSDVDGTLLDSEHHMLPSTKRCIEQLQAKGFPFVIVSGRNPGGVRTVMRENGFSAPFVSFSGALIVGEDGKVLYQNGFGKKKALEIVSYIEGHHLDCSWNIYAGDEWIADDAKDPRVVNEGDVIGVRPDAVGIEAAKEDIVIGKILLLCSDAEHGSSIREELRNAFPEMMVTTSHPYLVEIMNGGVDKALAIREYCKILGCSTKQAIAFGDNYNDVEMLDEAGRSFLMANAPAPLKARGYALTDDCDHDGIYHALKKLNLVE